MKVLVEESQGASREASPWLAVVAKVGGLAVTIACWRWASNDALSWTSKMALIWCAPLAVYAITLFGRRALDAHPSRKSAEWIMIAVHYLTGIALGIAAFPAIRLVQTTPAHGSGSLQRIGSVLVAITGVTTALTVLNLAIRGLGAPFAIKLSSRLATDWMYAWTRNPMLLSTLALAFCIGLRYGSLWFLVWVVVCLSPPWILFVKICEERELEIRFGPSYADYRARTPFLLPRRPRR